MRRAFVLVVCVVCALSVVTACERQSEGTQPDEQASPSARAEPSVPGAPKANEPAAAPERTFERAATPAEAQAMSKAFKKLLNSGRSSVKAGKYAEGIADFEAARKIDPNNARVLSELGWAALKSEDLEGAERYTRESIRFALDAKVSGASYYNLGRIHEAREETDAAATAYARSLEVRPGNEIVAQRLADLEAKGARAEAARELCVFRKMEGAVPEPKDACARYVMASEHDFERDPKNCEALEASRVHAMEGGVRAVVFTFRTDEVMMKTDVLAILREGDWYTSPVGVVDILGNSYNGQESWVESMESAVLTEGARADLRLTYRFDFYDGDYEDNVLDSYERIEEMAIAVHGGVPQWLVVAKKTERSETAPWLEGQPSSLKAADVHHDRATELTWDASAGSIVFEAAKGKASAEPEGTYALGNAPVVCPAMREDKPFF